MLFTRHCNLVSLTLNNVSMSIAGKSRVERIITSIVGRGCSHQGNSASNKRTYVLNVLRQIVGKMFDR